jgi:hypothetical protein
MQECLADAPKAQQFKYLKDREISLFHDAAGRGPAQLWQDGFD